MYINYYLSNGLFSLIILLIIYFNSVMCKGKTRCDVIFRVSMIFGIALAVLDTASWLLSGQDIPFSILLQHITNGGGDLCIAMISFLWLVYVHEKLISSLKHRKRRRLLFQIPVYISTILLITNPFHHFIFYINDNLEYVRGPLFAYLLGIPFGYISFASVLAIYQYRKEIYESRKKECLLMASFPILPLMGATIQALYFGLSLYVPCLTLAFVLIYLNQQNISLTLDSLTKVNNRGQLDFYLNKRFLSATKDETFYFILVDVDKFKEINDVYGHIAGDEALILLSTALKQAFKQKDAFLARYGGDEFAVIIDDISQEEIVDIIHNIESLLDNLMKSGNKPYNLTVSAGFALCNISEMNSVNDLVAKADAEMFKIKNAKKREKVKN